MGITRRDLLKGVAVGTVALGCGTSNPDGPPSGDDDVPDPVIDPPDGVAESTAFVLGVSAGDLAGTRGVVWTQYAGTAALTAYAWRVEGDQYVEQLGPFAAVPGDGGFTHAAIEGLQPGARYRYVFFEGERVLRSRIGKFRAPIADDSSEVVTFGAIACTEASRSTDPIAKAAAHAGLDAFLFVGDNAYCDADTVATYRRDYAKHFGRPAHVDLRAAHGMYITWDDHEVSNDWDPETTPAAQIAAAFTTFFDHAPIARDAAAPDRIWRSARWGKTVEVFVLDCRSERLPSTRNGANAQYLSPAQLAWLEAGLASSPARFKLVMNSVPISNMPNVWDLYKKDRWEAYDAQRTRILKHIDDKAIKGVLWLSGDFHLAFISNVSTSGAGATQREVLCGPGGQSPNALLPSLTAPQFSFKTGTNNYTTLKFDPGNGEVAVAYYDGAGTAFHTESFVV